jgi:NADP-dependent 3-hydroxy acid dehydrogenase YdfG
VSGASVQQKDTGSINVLVTGASSGIGKSIVMEFAKSSKYRVWATMRSLDSWTEPHMDNVEVAMMDVTSDSSVTNTITDMINKEGRIDIVVNNAGYGIVGCLEAVSIDAAKDLFEVNVWGVVRVLQAVLPHMRKEKSGHIIAVSSIAGIRGIPAYEFYTGSKFALEGIMDSMRYTLYPYNIHVTNVSPGPVKTGFLNRVSEPTSIETRKVANDNEDYISGYRDLALSDFNKYDAFCF